MLARETSPVSTRTLSLSLFICLSVYAYAVARNRPASPLLFRPDERGDEDGARDGTRDGTSDRVKKELRGGRDGEKGGGHCRGESGNFTIVIRIHPRLGTFETEQSPFRRAR